MSEQRRWPKNAETARTETIEAAREAQRLAGEARGEMKRNPLLAEVKLADVAMLLERIQRLMTQAKQGQD